MPLVQHRGVDNIPCSDDGVLMCEIDCFRGEMPPVLAEIP